MESEKQYIHYRKMIDLMNATDKKGKPVPFSMTFVRLSDGAIDHYKGCWLTSRHSKGGTINVRCPHMNRPHKVRICLILTFNGKSLLR